MKFQILYAKYVQKVCLEMPLQFLRNFVGVIATLSTLTQYKSTAQNFPWMISFP